jgi:hypothetical protein
MHFRAERPATSKLVMNPDGSSCIEVPVHAHAFLGIYLEQKPNDQRFVVSEAQDVSKTLDSNCR